jgi:predicted ATPase/tetratricopeptide (TPR) repeat protein
MANLEEAGAKAGTLVGLRQELTPAKIIGGVSIGLIGTFVTWLGSLIVHDISLHDFLWPWGILVFLLLLSLLLIADNVRLRRRAAKAVTATTPIPQHVNALDPSAVLGREEEIDQVVAFVMSDERKFLCLHGPGGVGKTTVARAALGKLLHLRTAFVGVDAVEERNLDPLAVDQAFAVAVATQGLGVPLVGPASPIEAVASALRLLKTRTALVIDNVEQVRKRAAPIIHRWVQESPLARIIVTSRVELDIGTERILEIDVFQPHPPDRDPAAMLSDPGPALELFARRRADRHPGFKLAEDNVVSVNRICEALGGLALGIELAAPVERTLLEIEVGIRKSSEYLKSSRPDLPERQRSLAATIDWSLGLLEEDSYALALQLSVAPGELDDEAISGIVRIPSSARTTYELVSALVGAQLLVRRERGERSTYREPVEVRRRCAELRLASPRDADRGAWSRFAATFVARAEAAYSDRYGPAVRQALDALNRDYDNLLVVAQRVEPTDPTVAARVAACLAWLIRMRRPSEPQREILTMLEAIVPREQHAVLSRLRTALSAACLDMWIRTGENLRDASIEWAERAVEAGDASSDNVILGEAHLALARVATRSDDVARAAGSLDAAVRHFVAARQFAAAAMVNAMWIHLPPMSGHKDKLDEAKRLLGSSGSPLARFEILTAEFALWVQLQTKPSTDMRRLSSELYTLAEEIASPVLLTTAMHTIALLESELDDQDRAFEALRKKADLQRAAGSALELGLTMNDMAAVLLRRRPLTDENLDRAIGYLDEALPLVEGRVPPHRIALIRGNRGWALLNRGLLKEALADSEAAVTYFEALFQWDRLNAFILAAMHAQIRHAAGDEPGAAHWAQQAQVLAEENGFTEASTSPEIRRHAQWLREYLGPGGIGWDR